MPLMVRVEEGRSFTWIQATDVNEIFRSVAERDAYLDAVQKQATGQD